MELGNKMKYVNKRGTYAIFIDLGVKRLKEILAHIISKDFYVQDHGSDTYKHYAIKEILKLIGRYSPNGISFVVSRSAYERTGVGFVTAYVYNLKKMLQERKIQKDTLPESVRSNFPSFPNVILISGDNRDYDTRFDVAMRVHDLIEANRVKCFMAKDTSLVEV